MPAMPYLRITCPERFRPGFPTMAERLTVEINTLFYDPRERITPEELRERTTVHFTPYAKEELYIGGRTPEQRGFMDLTAELSDWYMSVRKQRQVARLLTPVLMELFKIETAYTDHVNIYFNSYPPSGFSVGGKLLADLVPLPGRLAKRLFG